MAVLEAVVQGKTLEEAGVNAAFLLRVAASPDLSVVYAKAREMSSYALEEEALGRLRAAVASGNPSSTALRAIDLLAQQLRWSAIKRNPNVYSEKAAVNVTVPIAIHTSLDLGAGIGSGTKEFPNIYEAKVEVAREVPLADLDPERPASAVRYGGVSAEEGLGGTLAPEEAAGTERAGEGGEVEEFAVIQEPRVPRAPKKGTARKDRAVASKVNRRKARVVEGQVEGAT